MPNIDQLSIEIEANAEKATKAIANLTSNLNGLSLALNRINTSKISGFSKSIESLSRTGKMVDDTTRTLEHMADTIADKFGVKSKTGLKAVRDGLNDLAEASKNFRANPTDQLWESVQNAQKGLTDAIKTYYTFKSSVDDTSKSLREFINVSAKSGTKISLATVAKDLGEDLSHFQKVLGKNFTSTLSSTTQGVKDLEEWLGELDKEFGTGYSNMALDEAVRKLVGTLEKAKTNSLSFEESLYHQKQAEADAKATVNDYTDAILELVKIENNVQSSGISDLINSLRGLNDVTVPDFSTFADAISTLNRVNVDKVIRNLDQIKESLASGIDLSAELGTKLDGLASGGLNGFVSDIVGNVPTAIKEMTSLVPVMEQITSIVPYVSKGFQEMVVYTGNVKNELVVVPNIIQTIGDNIVNAFQNPSIDYFVTQLNQITTIVPYVANSLSLIADNTNNAVMAIGDAASKMTSLATNTTLESGYIDEMTARMWAFNEAVSEASKRMIGTNTFTMDSDVIDAEFREIPNVANAAEESIKRLTTSFREYKTAIVETGAVNPELSEQAELMNNIREAWDRIGSSEGTEKVHKSVGNLHGAFMKLSSVVTEVGEKLGHLGDMGVKGLSLVYTPLKNLVEEYREKIDKVVGVFKSMRTAVEKELTKMAAFWKRTMRTFTFMLVRKAITAMIKDVKEAVDELALFEKEMGTLSNGQFNKSLSEITADFHYIGRAIVAAFEPLINFVVPALNAVASAIANILALIGEFFAAFTGQNYFVTARKTVVDYGDSLDKNNKKLKEQKKLLLGIDELNVQQKKNDNSSGGGGGVSYKDAFDEKPVSDKMKALAEKIKEILGKLFDPLRKAWDNVGDYVIRGFKYLGSEIARLAVDIGRDFLTMWNEPETQRILESILRTIGNLEYGLGRLIGNFADSWETYGLGIFEKLRDNFGILQKWIEKTSFAFKNWAKDVHFDNLLSAIDQLLIKTQALCEFIGGVFYDVMTRVVMKFVEFLIEDGIPHLITTIGEVIDAFDFDKIRGDLQVLEGAFETMAEQIDIGVTNAIGNVGKALAEWMNSDEFTKFCDALAYFMSLVTAERVEKLFTALGEGLLETAKGIASFVSSDGFRAFVDKIIEWYDSKSAEEIAGYLEKIAYAIGLFKFAEFVAPGVAGFLTFIGTLVNFSNIAAIAGNLEKLAGGVGAVGTSASAAGGATSGFGAALSGLAAPVAIVVGVLATLLASFGGVEGTLNELKTRFDEVKQRVSDAINNAFLPMDGAIKTVKDAFSNLIGSLGSFRGAWVLVLDILKAVADVILVTLGGALSGLLNAFGGLINFISGAINIVGGALSTIAGIVQGFIGIIQLVIGTITGNEQIVNTALGNIQKSFEALKKGVTDILTGIGQAFTGAFQAILGLLMGFVNGVIDFFKELKYNLIGDPIVIDMVNGILGWFQTLFTDGVKWISDMVKSIIGFFGDLLTGALEKAGSLVTDVGGKIKSFKDDAVKKFDEFKKGAVDNFKNAVSDVTKKAGDIKKNVADKLNEIPKNAADKLGKFKSTVSDKFKDAKSAIKDKMDESVDVVKDKLGRLKDKFSNVDLSNVASNIIRGFISGLKQAWQGVVQWANEAVSNLKDKFKEALKIQSPSKVFMEYGKFTVEGFNEGLEKMDDSTSKVVDNWVDSFSNVQVNMTPQLTPMQMPKTDTSYQGTGLTDSMNNMVGQIASTNTQNNETKIILQVDGRTLYETVVKQNNQQLLRTGKSLLAY